MIINNIDVGRYLASFSQEGVSSALQIMDIFGCCDELKNYLELQRKRTEEEAIKITKEREARGEIVERPCDGRGKVKEEVPPLKIVVGFCPRCNSKMVGTPVWGCAKDGNDRHFYKECTACTYYSEIFKKRNIFIEKEGG
jgi:hypothetical protein